MVSQIVYDLCHSQDTVSSEFAKDPSAAPGQIAKRLYGERKSSKSTPQEVQPDEASSENLKRAFECGSWGPCRPSELFLQIYHDALQCLDKDALSGGVSPPLMGSHGVMPLTVIASVPDIARHMSNIIVRAEKEVFLVTCSWMPSIATKLLSDALKELSKRMGRRGTRAIVKVMYDKAGPANFINAHQAVKPETYGGSAIQLPFPAEIPNVDLQVTSLHKPLLGTLHAKFLVVDRCMALVQSNNLEDNHNMEMMTHLEGPIVDSIYDYALITWSRAFDPTLPSHDTTATKGGLGTSGELAFEKSETSPNDHGREQHEIVAEAREAELPEHNPGDPHYDDDIASEVTRVQSVYSPKHGESHLQAINRQLNSTLKKNFDPTGPEPASGEEFTPYIPHAVHEAFPIALVGRPPYGAPNNADIMVPQNQAWLSSIRNAKSSIFIQTPDLNAEPLIPALVEALKRGIDVTYYVCLGYNDAGEMMPGQGGTNETVASSLCSMLNEKERSLLKIHYFVAKDQIRPIHHQFGARACHIKLLIADDHIGIQGSGNQDTQSWSHSQEINILIDSSEICRKWREGIERNQNTARYGKAAVDGVWRDENGAEVEGATPRSTAPMSWVYGFMGMAKKVQEKGGFA